MNDRAKEFRSARMIELHDAGIVIHPRDYSDVFAGWAEFPSRGQVFTLSGQSIQHLCDHFKVPVSDISRSLGEKKGKVRLRMEDYGFPIFERSPFVVGHEEDGRWVENLSARLVSANLLEMEIEWGLKDSEEGAEEIEFEKVTVSYVGSFTVWWRE